MDQAGLLIRAALTATAAALAMAAVACGGGRSSTGSTGDQTTSVSSGGDGQAPFVDSRAGLVTPAPVEDGTNRYPPGPSVTYNDPPPSIAADVLAAATAAGCAARGVQAEPAELQPDGTYHVAGDPPAPRVSVPPLSGLHNDRWADWGVYDRPVPFKYQVHDLEHGGVILSYGRDVPVAGVNALRELWAKSPAYVIVLPDTHPRFPAKGVVAGSWQRELVCGPFTPSQIKAIGSFVNAYRGTGPEPAGAVNARVEPPPDLPAPAIADPGAKG